MLITAGNELFRQLGDPQRLDIERFPDLFLGGVLLAVMLLRPSGLLGDHDLAGWLRRRWRRPDMGTAVEPVPGTRPLVADDIVVRFGGFTALDGAASAGRARARSSGSSDPTAPARPRCSTSSPASSTRPIGTVRLGEHEPRTAAGPTPSPASGLARTFQNLRLFKDLTVRENVALAALVARRYRRDRATIDVDALLADAGLTAEADRRAGTLDYGNQRRLELARAAALAPEFLLLDEPTSGMSDAESLAMVDHVRSTAAKLGAGVLVIDHDLGFITRISDHIVVLAEGRVLAEGTPDEVRRNPAVAAAYLGSRADPGQPAT